MSFRLRQDFFFQILVLCPTSNLAKGVVVFLDMKRGRPRKFEVILTEREQVQLEQMRGSRTLPAGIVRRARGILLSAQGQSNQSIADQLKVSEPSVVLAKALLHRPAGRVVRFA